jgi:hypothetical protein
MFEAALGTVFAFIFIGSYFNIRRLAGYAALIDIAVFVLCVYLFMGTYAGMMTGIIAGLMFSVFLRGVRRCAGYEKLHVRMHSRARPEFYWKRYEPTW